MTREQLIEGVDALKPWFHKIDLGQGISTKTESSFGEPADHPIGTWEQIEPHLPPDLAGSTVLDVGCNAGFYAIEAKRRGAERVVGIDTERHHVRQARFAVRALGLDVEFRRESVYALSLSTFGQFDVTLALGLIYHCKHPIEALERLFLVTRRMLILESAVLPAQQTPGPFQLFSGPMARIGQPLAYVVNEVDAKESAYNWFVPSVACLQAMLRQVGFDDAHVASVFGDRVVILARKTKPYLLSSRPMGLKAALAMTAAIVPDAVQPRQELRYELSVENVGSALWLSGATVPRGGPDSLAGTVALGVHLLDEQEEVVDWDFGRVSLERDVLPGERARLAVSMTAPEDPGIYIFEFDMVSEHVAWFEDLGSPILTTKLHVAPGPRS